MDERLVALFEGDADGWVVGGAVRDELLGRPVIDVDIACRRPKDAAHRFAALYGGVVFPLSERHGAWRVVVEGAEETVDFTPLPDGIEADLATRDFTLNAIALPLAGGDPCDPHHGRDDLQAGTLRAVSDSVFRDDPLRLLRAVRLEDELGFALDDGTERLLRESVSLVTQSAGERILVELRRLSPAGYRRLDDVGLLAPLGGTLERDLDAVDDPDYRLVAVFGETLGRLPISNELRRYARALLRAERPEDPTPRSIHRFRRSTEPWALHALAFVGSLELSGLVEAARKAEPAEPLVRGDELGLSPGPAIGRILAVIDEERAAGTVTTREEALELARSLAAEGEVS